MTPLRNWKTILALIAIAVIFSARLLLNVSHQKGHATEATSIFPALTPIHAVNPTFGAEAVYIERLGTHQILFAKNENKRLPIASLTKLMTSLLFEEAASPLAEVPMSPHAKQVGSPDDKRSDVPAGEKVKAEDLLKLILIASDNDAAYAAAEYAGTRMNAPGSSFEERVRAFIAAMNARASSIGLPDTHFANPAGSDDPENYSSASDMAALAGYIAKEYPNLWEISRTQETFIFGASGARFSVVNTDPLLGQYPSLFGTKTGYEDQARGALTLLYEIGRDDLIAIVILKSPDRFADGDGALKWFEKNFAIDYTSTGTAVAK